MQQKKKENNARMLSGNDEKKVDTWKCMLSVLPLCVWENYSRLTSKLCQIHSLILLPKLVICNNFGRTTSSSDTSEYSGEQRTASFPPNLGCLAYLSLFLKRLLWWDNRVRGNGPCSSMTSDNKGWWTSIVLSCSLVCSQETCQKTKVITFRWWNMSQFSQPNA